MTKRRPSPSPAAPRRTALLAAAVCLLSAAPLWAANPEYISLAGLKTTGFQKFLADARDQGYEPVYINGYEVGDHVEYAGVAVKDPDHKQFDARFDLTHDELQDCWKEMMKKEFRPTTISTYHTKDGPRFAVVSVTTKFDKNPVYWHTKSGELEKDYDDTAKAMRKDGFLPMQTAAYQGPDGAVRYWALFYVPAKGQEWETKHDMTADQYQAQLDKWNGNGFRIMRVHVYDSPNGLRFLATARKADIDKKHVWEEHHDMTGEQYQKMFDKLGDEGFRPGCICGYRDGGQTKFAVVWAKDK